MKNIFAFITVLICCSVFNQNLYAMGGPGGGGGGDCFQFETQGEIISCSNCSVVDGIAVGDIDSDPGLSVIADGCGPVTLTVEYSFNWDQGSAFNWIHGVSFDAGPLWTNFDTGAPAGWAYMDTGVTGCCSGLSYGAGYYYDGTNASSEPQGGSTTWTLDGICGMGVMCTASWTYTIDGCTDWCDPDWEANVPPSTGGDCCDGLDFTTYFAFNEAVSVSAYASTLGLAPAANDGDPSNNWGVNCGVNLNGTQPACPVFTFELTYCPTNTNPSDFTEYITFTTSADGESGCWCTNAGCDYANGFDVTIQDACGPDASFDAIPDDYCTAASIDLNNPSAGYDNGYTPDPGAEWTGDGVVSGGPINVSFDYCDNVGNSTLTHIVGENNCYDGPITETFEVWTPEIIDVTADIIDGCDAFAPVLSADVVIAGTNTTWGGTGTLEWYDCSTPPGCGSPVTDFTVTPDNCAPVSSTFYPYFNTGCLACDVVGPSITITAHPVYTELVILNPAECGTAEVQIIGNDGVTVCQSYTASCPNPDDTMTIPYSFTTTGTGCDVNFSGDVICNCAGCEADAGLITIPK